MLLDSQVLAPMDLWTQYLVSFSQDHTLQLGSNESLAIDHTLSDINHQLEEHGKSLHDYGLPLPIELGSEVIHELEKWAPEKDTHLLCVF